MAIKAASARLEAPPQFGARRPIVEELLTWAEIQPIEWREPKFDLAELAVLRWIKGDSVDDLAAKYGKTKIAIHNYFQELRRRRFQVPGLSEPEIKKIAHLAKSRAYAPTQRPTV